MWIKTIVALSAAALLAACTSTAQLQSYVGRSLITPVLENGPPAHAYDMGDGTRAFIWEETTYITTPGTTTTTGNTSLVTTGHNTQIYGTQTTTITPASVRGISCSYVLLAQRTRTDIEGPAAWTVVDYRPADFLC